MNTVEENSNTNERPVVDPDEIAIDDINRQFIPLSQHESYDDDTDDPKRRVKMKVFRPPCKEKINAFYILWFYYLNPINKTKVADFMNIGSSVKLQVLNHLYTGQKNYRNKNHQYGFGAHLLQSYYLKIKPSIWFRSAFIAILLFENSLISHYTSYRCYYENRITA